MDEELATLVAEGGLPSTGKSHTKPSLNRQSLPVESHGAVPLVAMPVNRYGPQRAKSRLGLMAGLVPIDISHLADDDYRSGTGQVELGTNIVVGTALKGEPMEYLFPKGDGRQIVAGGIELPHNGEKGIGIAPYRYYGGDYHALII